LLTYIYNKGRDFGKEIICRNMVSLLSKLWDKFMKGCYIVMGNGSETSFWDDIWLERDMRLCDKYDASIPENVREWKVAGAVYQDETWMEHDHSQRNP